MACLWSAGRAPAFEVLLAEGEIRAERVEIPLTGTVAHSLYLLRPGPAKMPEG